MKYSLRGALALSGVLLVVGVACPTLPPERGDDAGWDGSSTADSGPSDSGSGNEDGGVLEDAGPDAGEIADAGSGDAGTDAGAHADAGGNDAGLEDAGSDAGGQGTRIRIVAGNITSGNQQAYGPEGIRIFQGLKPDIALVQEMNYGTNTPQDIRAFVDAAFGPQFFYAREENAQIANGVVSRYPILESGTWDDPQTSNREFSWARIDIPGPVDLWAVSVHLLTASAGVRLQEATALLAQFQQLPPNDYVVLGGDFNTDSRGEAALTKLSSFLKTGGPYPVDQDGVGGTNRSRSKPYDWVLADAELDPLEVPVKLGGSTFTNGLVLDSRVYSPLSEVTPIQSGDSAAMNMQHMAVVRDFVLP